MLTWSLVRLNLETCLAWKIQYRKVYSYVRVSFITEFSCAGCNASYIGESTRHLCTRVREHLLSDKSSHVQRHLQSSGTCHDSCDTECFTTSDSAASKFQIQIKEALHIKWENPILNQQLRHLDLSLSFIFMRALFFFFRVSRISYSNCNASFDA